jgi:hypothetical protein
MSVVKCQNNLIIFQTHIVFYDSVFDLKQMPFSNFSTKIRLGDHTLSTDEDCYHEACAPRYQEFGIARAVPHQSYKTYEKDDIAILILDQTAIETGKLLLVFQLARCVC